MEVPYEYKNIINGTLSNAIFVIVPSFGLLTAVIAQDLIVSSEGDLPFGGSYACAYDSDNERVYIHQGKQRPPSYLEKWLNTRQVSFY